MRWHDTGPRPSGGAGGQLHGVDISGPMLAHAAERAATAGLGNVQFTLGNAAIHPVAPT